MKIHMSCKRYNEELPKSVDAEFEERFRGLSWCIHILYWLYLWIDFELPWQHFSWRYKQSNIENAIQF